MPTPIAVAFSDLHLSLQTPACRADKDWLEVQACYLRQIEDTAGELPILFAGDLFDRWNPPPELIHFALQYLPNNMLCIPGNHDLPQHRMEDMHRSGYGVLKEAKKIRDASDASIGPFLCKGQPFVIYGFGWDQEITPPSKDWDNHPIGKAHVKIALIHRYCWVKGKAYPGAEEANNVIGYKKALKDYDIAIFGDNHNSFIVTTPGSAIIVNCGGAIRRKSDEIDREPGMAIIYSDGSVKRKRFDTSIDRFHENAKEREECELDVQGFIKGLEELGEEGLNFRTAVENHLRADNISPETKQIILKALEQQ